MPGIEDHDTIRQWAENERTTPPQSSWNRVRARLDQRNQKLKKRRIDRWRIALSLAASLVILLGFFSVVHLESHIPQEVQKGKIESIEELSAKADYFYSVENARLTYKDYSDLY